MRLLCESCLIIKRFFVTTQDLVFSCCWCTVLYKDRLSYTRVIPQTVVPHQGKTLQGMEQIIILVALNHPF